MQDRTELLRILIAAGAKINAVTNRESSPLYDVITQLSVDKKGNKQDVLPLVSVLIQHGADTNFVSTNDDYGCFEYTEPLVIAAIKSSDSLVLQTILNAGGKLDNLKKCPLQACLDSPGNV